MSLKRPTPKSLKNGWSPQRRATSLLKTTPVPRQWKNLRSTHLVNRFSMTKRLAITEFDILPLNSFTLADTFQECIKYVTLSPTMVILLIRKICKKQEYHRKPATLVFIWKCLARAFWNEYQWGSKIWRKTWKYLVFWIEFQWVVNKNHEWSTCYSSKARDWKFTSEFSSALCKLPSWCRQAILGREFGSEELVPHVCVW